MTADAEELTRTLAAEELEPEGGVGVPGEGVHPHEARADWRQQVVVAGGVGVRVAGEHLGGRGGGLWLGLIGVLSNC